MHELEAGRRLGLLFGANRFCAIGKVVYSVCVPIALNSSGICDQLKIRMPI